MDADAHVKGRLNYPQMRVMLTEQFAKKAVVVEVEFERIFGG